MRTNLRLWLAAVGIPALAMVAGALLRDAWSARIPDQLAVHWANGEVDGHASTGPFVTGWFVAAAVLTLAGALLIVIAKRRGFSPARSAIGFVSGLATFAVSTLFAMLHANLDGVVTDNPMPQILTATAGAVTAGALASLIAGPAAKTGARGGGLSPDKPSVDLAPGERATWIGGTRSPVALAIVAIGVVATVVLPLLLGNEDLNFAVLLPGIAIGGVVLLLLASLKTVVDSSGVGVRIGALGLLRRHVPLAEIDSAETSTLSMFANGGLGVRVNPVTGDTAYKLRGGPALTLNLTSGKRVLISVDRPEGAAGLVNDLLRERAGSPESPSHPGRSIA